MLKLFNRKKKDNKGFTLVELVIVIAILAILVGLLAPQYTKYVEKSRKTADANNLEEIVKEIKVVASDPTYAIQQGTFDVVINSNGGTTITFTPDAGAGTITGTAWTDGMNALLEGTWTSSNNVMTCTTLNLKSNKWKATGNIVTGIAANQHAIGAHIAVEDDGTMDVTYDPATIKEGTF